MMRLTTKERYVLLQAVRHAYQNYRWPHQYDETLEGIINKLERPPIFGNIYYIKKIIRETLKLRREARHSVQGS